MDVKNAFLDVVYGNIGIIKKICRAYTRTSTDAADLEQDILCELWRAFPSFKGQSKIQTWMYSVALNTALLTLRKKKTPAQEYTDGMITDSPLKEIQSEQVRRIYEFIHTLQSVDKNIMLLYLDEFSYNDIADMTGLTEKNVSVRIVRLKSKLQEWLTRIKEAFNEQ